MTTQEPDAKKLTKFVGFRLDRETQDLLDQLGDNRSAVLRDLVQRAGQHYPPPQERESAL